MNGIEAIASERRRQVAEGWTSEHDAEHSDGEMALAAVAYVHHARGDIDAAERDWPWSFEWWKPSDPIRNLVKAGALIAAEIDRLAAMKEIRR